LEEASKIILEQKVATTPEAMKQTFVKIPRSLIAMGGNTTDAPYKGDPDTKGVALKRIDKNTIEETTKLNGEVVSLTRMAVGSDGKSMTVPVQDAQDGTTNQFTILKQ
jgi:hypothetical protein